MFDEFDDMDELKEGPEKVESDDEAPKEMGLGKVQFYVFALMQQLLAWVTNFIKIY